MKEIYRATSQNGRWGLALVSEGISPEDLRQPAWRQPARSCQRKKRRNKMIYISNAFSLQMLPDGLQIMVKTVSIEAVQQRLAREPWCSIIGHADTAAVVSNQLGFSVRLRPH